MALRKIVKIDEDKCTGCGECVPACAEGAIRIIDGKARLIAENLCDGLGACLGDCPEDAITIEEREADDFDEDAVKDHLGARERPSSLRREPSHHLHPPGGGCPGARAMTFEAPAAVRAASSEPCHQPSALRQWPVQLHLVSPTAPYFKGADILLAADCVAFSVGDFHGKHLEGKSLAIACPKLDSGADIYLEKLVTMIDSAEINTLTVMIMEVPCCAGLLALARRAQQSASRKVPVKKVVVGLKGDILSEEWV